MKNTDFIETYGRVQDGFQLHWLTRGKKKRISKEQEKIVLDYIGHEELAPSIEGFMIHNNKVCLKLFKSNQLIAVTKRDKRENGYWVSWNDFLGVELKHEPEQYLQNMIEELEDQNENSEKFINECKQDIILLSTLIDFDKDTINKLKRFNLWL